ncbi:MAG TPA: penicillin-binding transpeptidase domain-containing protein [Jiangellaceae bacterium]|nr:penicillin-binding transpeptidase domain-containing protein [Jiangellaceae bacterium]
MRKVAGRAGYRLRAAAIGVILAFTLASCASTPDAQPAANALAAALTSRDFNEIPLRGATPRDATLALGEITEPMGESTWSVSVQSVDEVPDSEGERREVTFEVTWDLEHTGEPWTYTTTARLELVEEEWQVDWSPALLHPDLIDGDQLALRRQNAPRADVLAGDGLPLVTERPVLRLGIDKTMVEPADQPASAEALADLVGVDPERFADRVAGSGERAFVEAITLREEDAEDMLDRVADITGARALEDTMPLAPTREFARPILGTLGEATAEIIEESDGRVQQGDVVGLSGLQRAYDEMLAGTPGVRVDIEPTQGDATTVYERAPVPGEPVTTTLDVDLQIEAERVLAEVEPASALVAIEPSTGHVLAAASGPGSGGYSTATLGQYAPGSTFKIASALALLRAGHRPDETVDCPDTITVDGRRFGNYSDYPSSELGEITVGTAFARSCNTAFIGLHDSVPQADLAAAAAALGIGIEADLGVPAFLGQVPTEAEGTEHAASMIGQGRVLASPLAMAAAAASVAAGHTVSPAIVVQDPEQSDSTLTADEAQELSALMRATVESGTGDFLQDVPGEAIGAKTGTAEYGSGNPPDTHGWMIAIQGDLAVAVFVEDAESGSATAGPLLEEFLRSAA